jgi:DNA-binding IclR family transcriptional regulator
MRLAREARGTIRALQVYDELLAGAAGGVRPLALARRLEVAPSTIGRILQLLVIAGHATRSADGAYRLGARPIAGFAESLAPVIQQAAPLLADLAARTGAVSELGVLVGATCVVLARGGAGAEDLGRTHPAWATAMGKALLARLRPAQRRRVLPAEPFPAFTPRTARTLAAVFPRRRAVAVYTADGELEPGRRCVAVPLTIAGAAVAVGLVAPRSLSDVVWRHAAVVLERETRALASDAQDAR